MLIGEQAQRAIEEVDLPGMLPPGIFHTLLHHPKLSRALGDCVLVVLQDSRLDFRTQKLCILRVAWLRGATYLWGQHARHALSAGFTDGDLLGVRNWHAFDGFSPTERHVLAATDELLRDGSISDPSWAECATVLDHPQLVDLVSVIAMYDMFAKIIAGLRIQLDEGLPVWPPDGECPRSGAEETR